MNLPNKLSLLRVALIPVMVALMLPQTLVCDLPPPCSPSLP